MEGMNDKQKACYQMLCDLLGGEHHINGKVKPCSPTGIECNLRDDRWQTYDRDGLTRLVLMSHERCIRAEIGSSAPGRIRLKLHKREGREGRIWERHPTIEQAIETFGGSLLPLTDGPKRRMTENATKAVTQG